jgi:transposase
MSGKRVSAAAHGKIIADYNSGLKIETIVQAHNCSMSTVHRILRRHRKETGVTPRPRRRAENSGLKPLLSREQTEIIKEFLILNPEAKYREIKAKIGVEISDVVMSRYVNTKLGFRAKMVWYLPDGAARRRDGVKMSRRWIPLETRREIVDDREKGRLTVRKISGKYGRDIRTISLFLKHYRETKSIEPKPTTKPVLSENELKTLEELVKSNPEITIDGIKKAMGLKLNNMSLQLILRNKLGFRVKIVRYLP